MRLEFLPTGLASKDNKKKWLIHEVFRFRNFIRASQTLKMLLSFGLVMLITSFVGGWAGLGISLVGLLLFDFFYEYAVFLHTRMFYIELAEACFDVNTSADHDFRILMNRVENFVKTEDGNKREALYKDLEGCYHDLRFKADLKEAFDDFAKGLKQEETKG